MQINPVSLGHKVIEHMHERTTKETCKILDKTLVEKDWSAETDHRYSFFLFKKHYEHKRQKNHIALPRRVYSQNF